MLSRFFCNLTDALGKAFFPEEAHSPVAAHQTMVAAEQSARAAAAAAFQTVLASRALCIDSQQVFDPVVHKAHIIAVAQPLLQANILHFGEAVLLLTGCHRNAGQQTPLRCDITGPADGAAKMAVQRLLRSIVPVCNDPIASVTVQDDDPAQHDVNRAARLVILRNITKHGVIVFDIAQGVAAVIAFPEIGHGDAARFQGMCAGIAQNFHRLCQSVRVSTVDAHFRIGAEAPRFAQAHGPQRCILCAGNAPHPVVPAHAVKAE